MSKLHTTCGFCLHTFLVDSRVSHVDISILVFYAVTNIVFKIKKKKNQFIVLS